MKNIIKNIIIIIELIIIIALIIYIILISNKNKTILETSDNSTLETNTNIENNTNTSLKKEYIKTYSIIEKLDISNESGNYDYYVIKEFQDDDPLVIKVDNKYNLEERKNYEFVLYGIKNDEKNYSQSEIFKNFEITDIRETNKTGLEQTQDL